MIFCLGKLVQHKKKRRLFFLSKIQRLPNHWVSTLKGFSLKSSNAWQLDFFKWYLHKWYPSKHNLLGVINYGICKHRKQTTYYIILYGKQLQRTLFFAFRTSLVTKVPMLFVWQMDDVLFLHHLAPLPLELCIWLFWISSDVRCGFPFQVSTVDGVYGCFFKWWYPWNTTKMIILVGKPMVVGYHHFRNPHILLQKNHLAVFIRTKNKFQRKLKGPKLAVWRFQPLFYTVYNIVKMDRFHPNFRGGYITNTSLKSSTE